MLVRVKPIVYVEGTPYIHGSIRFNKIAETVVSGWFPTMFPTGCKKDKHCPGGDVCCPDGSCVDDLTMCGEESSLDSHVAVVAGVGLCFPASCAAAGCFETETSMTCCATCVVK